MSYPSNKLTAVKRDKPLASKLEKTVLVIVKRAAKADGRFVRAPALTANNPISSYLDERGRAKCLSCRKKVYFTELREHLGNEHLFTQNELDLLDAKVKYKSVWVQFVQGGLPGLGKKR